MFDDNKRKKLRVTLMAAAIATLSVGQGYAAGLGKLTVLSGLGQPLRAELDISASKEELVSLAARIAPQESFRQANIEYSGILSSLRFTLDKRSGGQPYFRVSSDRAIGEPFLDLLVELSWSSGRLVREYTFLLDPPELTKPVAAEVPPPVTPPVLTMPVRREVEKPVAASTKAAEKPAEKAPARTVKPTPAPVAAKASPAAESQATTRTVQKGDTLGKIAAEVRPEGVNLDQMLVALFRSNQEAFEGGNINRLKAGKILSIPEKEAIAAVDANEARKVVLTHSADFDGYRRKLAGAVADSAPAREDSKQSSGGKITAKVEDKAPVAPGKDKLQVSRTEASGDAAKLKALEEDKAIKEKALKDAQGRIAELEKNVADLRKLAELKSQTAADLQKQAAAKAALEAIKKPEAPAKPAEAMKPAEPAKADAEVAKAPADQPAEAAKTAVMTEEEKAGIRKPDSAAKPAAVPPPAPLPVEEPSFIDENGPLMYGGAGVLALLAAYLGFNARRRKKAAAAPAAKHAFASNAVQDDDADEGVSLLDELPSVAAKADEALPAEADMVDPIREADAFMAYGRDAQAEEVLLDALAKTPENLHVHLKLLEIYSARKSVPQFNTVAQSLFSQTGGFGLEWERAVALGRVLDPSNPFYGTLEVVEPIAPVSVAEAPVAQLAAEESVEPPIALPEAPESATAPVEASTVLDEAVAAPAETEPAPAQTPEPETSAAAEALVSSEEAETHALDLDFDLAAVAAEQAAVVEAAAAETVPAAVEPLGIEAVQETKPLAEPADAFASLDFDLNLGEPVPATEAPVVAEPAAAPEELLNIDFDLGDLTPSTPAASEAAVAAPEAPAGNSLDFDLGTEAAAVPAAAAEVVFEAAPEADTALAAPAPLDLDFNLDLDALPAVDTAVAASKEVEEITPLDFDFDLGSTPLPSVSAVAEATEPAPPALGLADIDLDLAALEAPVLEAAPEPLPEPLLASEPAPAAEEERPEVTTKLELAQAYEEMGDLEGAKELFQEVLAEGNSTQQALAQEKLDKLV